MMISQVDSIVEQIDPPTRETIEDQRQKQLDALKLLRLRLREAVRSDLRISSFSISR